MPPDQPSRLPSVILTLIVIALILFVGNFAINETIAIDDTGGRVNQAVLLDGTNSVTIADTVGQNEEVYDSLGYAINLSGNSNSYFKSTRNVSVASDDTWFVSVWASVDNGSENSNMTAVSVNGRLLVNYQGTTGNWTAWYYESGGRNSYQINVSTANQPGNLTNIIVVRDGNTLSIYRNDTAGESVDVSTESHIDAPVNNSNWDGRIDELRTGDDALTAGQRASLVGKPVAPLANVSRTGRVMFDQDGKSRQLFFFAAGDINTNNVEYSSGLTGHKLQGEDFFASLTGSTDYRWSVTGPKIQPVSGEELDGAPVAYVEYDRQGELDTLADDWTNAMQMAAILLIVVPLGSILVYLEWGRGGR